MKVNISEWEKPHSFNRIFPEDILCCTIHIISSITENIRVATCTKKINDVNGNELIAEGIEKLLNVSKEDLNNPVGLGEFRKI